MSVRLRPGALIVYVVICPNCQCSLSGNNDQLRSSRKQLLHLPVLILLPLNPTYLSCIPWSEYPPAPSPKGSVTRRTLSWEYGGTPTPFAVPGFRAEVARWGQRSRKASRKSAGKWLRKCRVIDAVVSGEGLGRRRRKTGKASRATDKPEACLSTSLRNRCLSLLPGSGLPARSRLKKAAGHDASTGPGKAWSGGQCGANADRPLCSVEPQAPSHLVFVHDRMGIAIRDAGVVRQPVCALVAAQERGA